MFKEQNGKTSCGLLSGDQQRNGDKLIGAQSGALCYRIENGRPEILLITTRRSGRWIVPKGWLIDGLSPSETAQREAWEEAGVIGHCGAESLGQFTYYKNQSGDQPTLCRVEVFPLHVHKIMAKFPEAGERKRKWFSPEKASLRASSQELAHTLSSFGDYRH